MKARETESYLVARCAEVARDPSGSAVDGIEANVFRLAGMVIRSEFPDEWRNLLAASQRYFDRHPDTLVEPGEVVRKGWIVSFPRLRDLLRLQLGRSTR